MTGHRCEAGGMNPGRTAEGIHLQPGVVGEDRVKSGLATAAFKHPLPPSHCLDAGIGLKGGARFLGLRPGPRRWGPAHLQQGPEHGSNLLHLVGVVSGHQDRFDHAVSKLEPEVRDNLLSHLG